jgi:hypothetical protein
MFSRLQSWWGAHGINSQRKSKRSATHRRLCDLERLEDRMMLTTAGDFYGEIAELPEITATMAPSLERQLSTLQVAVDPTNPHDELTLTVDWGDGSAPQVFACPSDTPNLNFTHYYAHDGQFTVTVQVIDDAGNCGPHTALMHNVLNVDITVVAAGPGGGPHVNVFDSNTHELKFTLTPYAANFRGGVHVATGDVNGDGVPDIITAPGAGASGGLIQSIDGDTGHLLTTLLPYGADFRGGIFVATGDVNGDGFADIITGPSSGAGPHVKVFSGHDNQLLSSFFAYGAGFTGGVRVAAGDVNGDGFDDIITGAGAGGNGHVKVFDGMSNTLLASFLAFPGFSGAFPGFRGGIFIAAGDFNGDGKDDIVVSPDRGAPPHVKIFSPSDNQTLGSFLAYDANFSGGVRVAGGDVNGDGKDDIITAPGNGSAPIRAFDGVSLEALDSFFTLAGNNPGGFFVAASRHPVINHDIMFPNMTEDPVPSGDPAEANPTTVQLVVNAGGGRITTEPSSYSEEVVRVAAGEIVFWDGTKREGFLHVTTKDGKSGWICDKDTLGDDPADENRELDTTSGAGGGNERSAEEGAYVKG